MRITCPECGFSRDVPDDKVPAATAVATCPKCRHRFRFRHFDDGFEPGPSAGEPPRSEPRYAGEQEGGDAPRSGFGATPRFSGAVRRGRESGDAADSGLRSYEPADNPYAPGASREHGRTFPPPSAHWEPSLSAEESPAPPDALPDAPLDEAAPARRAPHPAAVDPAAGPEHEEERLRVDVRDASSAPSKNTEVRQEPNGVRDIWARLQAMDDEDGAPPPPPGPHGPGGISRAVSAPGGESPAARAAGPAGPAGHDPSSGARPQAAPSRTAPADEDSFSPGQASAARSGDPVPGGNGSAPDEAVPGGDGRGAPDSPDSPGSSDSTGAYGSSGPWPGRSDDAAQGEVPWERLDAYGFFPGLVLTFKRILFQPVEFFESMPLGRGKGKALVFNLLLSEFLLLVDFLWALLGVRAKLADTGQTDALAAMAGVPGIGFLILLVMVPVFMAAGIFLDAGLTHLLLKLLRGSSKKFDETFRVMCYSAAPTVLSAVPVAGQLLSPVILIWYMTLQAIGLKKVHGAAYSQALAVVLIKWSLYLFLLLGMLHSLSSGG